jgi:hypothetical protein
MKKWMFGMMMLIVFVSCGDNNREDFDPRRIEIVTGMNLTDANGIPVEQWGNPNVPSNVNFSIFPKPAFESIRIRTNSAMQRIWLIRGVPTQLLFDTDFDQVFAETPYQFADVEAYAFRTIETPSTTEVDVSLTDITQGYYRVFIELANGSIIWDNIYVQGSNTVDFIDINFWDI